MKKDKVKTDINKLPNIIKNAIIKYNDGYTTVFDAIYINGKEVVFGKISDKDVFTKCGGIPKENIEKIVVLDK
jgi:hypothetical protein